MAITPAKVALDLYGKKSVILKTMGDWPQWYAAIRQAAKWKGVWEYIDLDVDDDKLPEAPQRVNPRLELFVDKMKELAITDPEMPEGSHRRLRMVDAVIDLDKDRRTDFKAGKGYVVWAILSTVAEPWVSMLYN